MQYPSGKPMFSVPHPCSIIRAFLTYTCSVMSIWCFNKAYWSGAAFLESFLSIILRTFGPSPWAYSVGTPQGTPVPTTCLSSVDMPGRGARRAVPGHLRQWWVQRALRASVSGWVADCVRRAPPFPWVHWALKSYTGVCCSMGKELQFSKMRRFWRSVSQYCEYT